MVSTRCRGRRCGKTRAKRFNLSDERVLQAHRTSHVPNSDHDELASEVLQEPRKNKNTSAVGKDTKSVKRYTVPTRKCGTNVPIQGERAMIGSDACDTIPARDQG